MVAAWQVASAAIGAIWVPSPGQVIHRAWTEWLSGGLLRDVTATTTLTLVGIGIGVVIGVGSACLLRLSPQIDEIVQPYVSAAMSVPKLALVPLLVLWFGTGWLPRILLVSVTATFIIFALTYSGLITIQSSLVMTAKLMGANSRQINREIVLPTIWPFILTGLEVAFPWAVSAAIVAEYLASKAGIGHYVEIAQNQADTAGVFYGILLATALVLLLNTILYFVRRLTAKFH